MESIYFILFFAALIIGISSSLMGGLMVLQKKTLLGDVVSHAILPGILVAFIISTSRNQVYVFLGALIAGWLAIAQMDFILKKTKLKSDAALAIVLSSYFSLGLVIYSWMQHNQSLNSSGLSNFIYGQLVGVSFTDLLVFTGLLIVTLIFIVSRFKYIVAQAFQEQFLQIKGFNIRLNQFVFNSILVLIIAMGVQAVGVILMSALLILPYVSASQLTTTIKKSLILAVVFSVSATILGCFISFNLDQMPTGPWIIVFLSCFFFFSITLKYFRKR
jgi:manganese/zinc/iron transport system permease protein